MESKAFEVLITARADHEIVEAFLYYELQQDGLGAVFLQILDETISYLSTNPFHAVRYRNVRMYRIRKFPYSIHFRVDIGRDLVQILAVLHTSRNPNTWPQD